ncbi:MAG: arginine--tRNA ligase [Ruminococcaceae bacterium]|nr:arginine--tRNA ligase [Oscillospiraceae bacterium]
MKKAEALISGELLKKINSIAPDAVTAQDMESMFTVPPEQEMGDLAFACFKLSKVMRKAPQMIAQQLCEGFECEAVSRVEAVAGYLNFYISDSFRTNVMLKGILEKGDDYGKISIGEGKTMVIDYSSPNIAKPFHIGHLGTTAIGNSIKRIYSYCGYNCIGINHLGDWGTQFGRLIVAYKNWGSKEAIEQLGVKELARIYKDFYVKAEEDPSLNDLARAEFTKIENGDEEALALWRWFKDISLKEFMKTYDRLGISFESYNGEAFYNDKMDRVVNELTEKGLLKESDGAMLVDLEEYDMAPCLILKNDGSTLYATRDIAAALYRKDTYDFDKCIYVTDAGQSLHFAQFFKVIGLMGYDWNDKMVHVPYGKISINGEKLATRTGNVVLLEELFDDASQRALKIIEQKNPDLENKEYIADKVGIGAVIFNQLSTGRIKDVNFVWEEALSFEGNTGPYVQYTYARTCSVLSKADIPASLPEGVALNEDEKALISVLSRFPQKVEQAHNDYEPSYISRYLLDVCAAFNRFYHNCPILKEEGAVRDLRVALTKAANTVIGNGLWLIGLEKTPQI